MEVKKQLVLREIAGDYALIPVGDTVIKNNGLFSLSETGARIWELLPQAEGTEQLVDTLLEEYDVDAVLWVGNPGFYGMPGAVRVITGEVNPSGHLVDIFARDFTQDPTWSNFGSNVQNGLDNYVYYDDNGTLTDSGYRSVEYREGIYIGYRWYETVAADMEAQSEGSGESWYQENVVYPFGYGLS